MFGTRCTFTLDAVLEMGTTLHMSIMDKAVNYDVILITRLVVVTTRNVITRKNVIDSLDYGRFDVGSFFKFLQLERSGMERTNES